VIKAKFKIYECQRATGSGAEQTSHCQWHLCVKQYKCVIVGGVFDDSSDVDPTVMKL
jgi:hypothetical protein